MMTITQEFSQRMNDNTVYSYNDIDIIIEAIKKCGVIKNNKKQEYYNAPCAFDIETTSFYNELDKAGVMYEWTLGCAGLVIIGRRWDEFIYCLTSLAEALELNKNKHLIVYVHNLSFEFQFIRCYLNWSNVFAIDERHPIKAITRSGIEFRCSYALSGNALAKIGEDLTTYKVKKLVGDLDYSLIRHSETPLTDKEIAYCVNDVKVVMAYIQEKIEQDGDITKLQLTKTSYVRKFCRNSCYYFDAGHRKKSYKFFNYRKLMNSLTITADEYLMARRAFQGGFTHANAFRANKVIEDVTSWDFTSSYPAQIVANKFPMSKGELLEHIRTDDDEFNNNIKMYCCVFDVRLTNVRSKLWQDHPISLSKCRAEGKWVVDNGRIVSADVLMTTITEQDYFTYSEFYEWDSVEIRNFRRYRRWYLPKDFIIAVLTLYSDKTRLKGIEDKIVDYQRAKEQLNSCYGMMVTDIVRDQNVYDCESDEWGIKESDIDKEIKKYNDSKNRFLFYLWGIYVTAYARRALFTGIKACGSDYIYSDTDSIKITNSDKHLEYIHSYNEAITNSIEEALKAQKIDVDMANPVDINGEHHPLGVWDFDGHYKRFKTLGAKRYMVEKDDGRVSITVSGVNKKFAVPYIQSLKRDVFDNFADGLEIPGDYTGKSTHTYIDTPVHGIITDYTGRTLEVDSLSSIHLEKAEYKLSMSGYLDYIDYILTQRKLINYG